MKNRLVGILVLLLLAVIGWPLLFEDDIDSPVDITPRITDNIEAKNTFEIKKPQHSLFDDEDIIAAETALARNEKPKSLAKEKLTQQLIHSEKKNIGTAAGPEGTKRVRLDRQGVPISWTLQLASFVDEKRALALKDRLQTDGYKSYMRVAKTDKGMRYRVYVGPNLNKQDIETLQVTIDKKYRVSSILTRHQAVESN